MWTLILVANNGDILERKWSEAPPELWLPDPGVFRCMVEPPTVEEMNRPLKNRHFLRNRVVARQQKATYIEETA